MRHSSLYEMDEGKLGGTTGAENAALVPCITWRGESFFVVLDKFIER